MAPLVECMEENNREKKILPRSWDLMKGQWIRATTLMTILSLAATVFMLIIWAAGALIIGVEVVREAFTGNSTGGLLGVVGVMLSSYIVVFTLFTPAFLLAMVLFYLDIRVRKDALDLEWTTHATAPTLAPTNSAATASAPYAVSGFENLSPAPLPVQPTVQTVQSPIQLPTQPPAATAPLPHTFEVPSFDEAALNSPPPMDVAENTPVEAVASWQSLIEEPNAAPLPNASTAMENGADEITCPVCGKKSPANYVFCMSCGTRLPGASESAPSDAPKW
jgi:hypothetical protein